jgi:hypothetical protein
MSNIPHAAGAGDGKVTVIFKMTVTWNVKTENL